MANKFIGSCVQQYYQGVCHSLNTWVLTSSIVLLSLSCTGQQKSKNASLEGDWFIELQHQDIGVVRTVMHFETDNKNFLAYTRKNADRDILGGWTSLLGRTFSKSFKEGSLLHIEQGIFAQEQDTLRLAGILTSAMGNYNIEGYIVNNELIAHMGNKAQGVAGIVKGSKRTVKLPLENYSSVFEQSLSLTEKNIYNKEIVENKAWKTFVSDMRSVSAKVQDDLEMVFAFFYYSGKLPLSHYALMKLPADTTRTNEARQSKCILEEKSPAVAYLKINSFDGSAAELDSLFSIILNKNYAHLIVDLRNNPGGNIEAGMAFSTSIADTTFYGGIFLTQKYFNQHAAAPPVTDYNKFPHFTAANFGLIIEGIHNTEGLCLKVIPKPNTYKGKVYFLTNKRTASTCEPIVYGFKQQHRALVIGERTAGAMLNGEIFQMDKGFSMIIPTADYYAADGFRIDQNGIIPDIETEQEKALDYVLQNLIR